MTMKRLRFLLFAIPVCLISVLIFGAQRSHPANVGGVIDPTCSSSLPCIEYDNNSTGPGIRGISVAGNGLAGSTKNHSTSSANGRAGLIGNDIGSGSFNSGVHGLSVSGTGVSGLSTSGIGVSGTTSNGVGVQGVSSNSVGMQGVSNTSDAVQGVIGSGVASSFTAVVPGIDRSRSGTTNQGVYGQSTNGIGIQAVSSNFIGAQVIGGTSLPSVNYPAMSVNGN